MPAGMLLFKILKRWSLPCGLKRLSLSIPLNQKCITSSTIMCACFQMVKPWRSVQAGLIMKRKVVITGIGVVSPVGNNSQEFCAAMHQGLDGAAPITRFDAQNFPVKKVCEVKNFPL